MIKSNSTKIEGTLSPTFLVGKTGFLFQEDIIFDTDVLKKNIVSIENDKNTPIYEGDLKLIEFVKKTTKEKISFDEIYSNYISKKDFTEHLTTIYKKEDCSESCLIGCGSDWGCCGNYKGCCYFSSRLCLLHDLECLDCKKWHCGPGCKPDNGNNTPVKYLVIS